MADAVPLTVLFDGADEVSVEFPDEGVTTSVPVTRVGENLYRLDAVPLFVEGAGFKDVVEAEVVEGGALRARRVAERSGWRTLTCVLSPSDVDGEWGQALLRQLEAMGGHGERVFGGLLFVCIPPGIEVDPTEWACA